MRSFVIYNYILYSMYMSVASPELLQSPEAFSTEELNLFGFFAVEGYEPRIIQDEEGAKDGELSEFIFVPKDLFEADNGAEDMPFSNGFPFTQSGDYRCKKHGSYTQTVLELGGSVLVMPTKSAAGGVNTVVEGIFNPLDFEEEMRNRGIEHTATREEARDIFKALSQRKNSNTLAVQGSSGGAAAAARFIHLVPDLAKQLFGEDVDVSKIVWFESDLSGSARDTRASVGAPIGMKLRATNPHITQGKEATSSVHSLADHVVTAHTTEDTARINQAIAQHRHPRRIEQAPNWPGLIGRKASKLGTIAVVPSIDNVQDWAEIHSNRERRASLNHAAALLNQAEGISVKWFDEGPMPAHHPDVLDMFIDATADASREDRQWIDDAAKRIGYKGPKDRKALSDVYAALSVQQLDPSALKGIATILDKNRAHVREWLSGNNASALMYAEPQEQYPTVGEGHMLPPILSKTMGIMADSRYADNKTWSKMMHEIAKWSLGGRLPDNDAWTGILDLDEIVFNINTGGNTRPRAIAIATPYVHPEDYAQYPNEDPVTAGDVLALAHEGGPLHGVLAKL